MSFLSGFFGKSNQNRLRGPSPTGHLDLTEAQIEAKKFISNLVLVGLTERVDESGNDILEDNLPMWYSAEKYERGRKVFSQNCYGIMQSSLYGLYIMLSEPKGLKRLEATGRSSSPSLARVRYGSTILQIINWYQTELTEESKAWISLNRVKKMHRKASEMGIFNELGELSQFELVFATIGYIGFVIVRPELLGIKFEDEEEKEAFVHFWSVVMHFLGVQQEFNFCDVSYPAVEEICKIFIRYMFIPVLQLEYPLYQKFLGVLMKGMHVFSWTSSYESRLFLTRRLAGVPGYQYNIDVPADFYSKAVFTSGEIAEMRQKIEGIPHYNILCDIIFPEKFLKIEFVKNRENVEHILDAKYDHAGLLELFEMDHINELVIEEIEEANIAQHLNANKYNELSWKDKIFVRSNIFFFKIAQKPVGDVIFKVFTKGIISIIKLYNYMYINY